MEGKELFDIINKEFNNYGNVEKILLKDHDRRVIIKAKKYAIGIYSRNQFDMLIVSYALPRTSERRYFDNIDDLIKELKKLLLVL